MNLAFTSSETGKFPMGGHTAVWLSPVSDNTLFEKLSHNQGSSGFSWLISAVTLVKFYVTCV
ncbi:hypothetical protein ACJX0J_022650, partial [Zea mays]